MKYGLELEFFVIDKTPTIVAAYKVTNNLDGNPVVGELRTAVHDNIVDAVFELKKLIFLESEKLKEKGYEMVVGPQWKAGDLFLTELRKDSAYTNRKELQPLDEKSIYVNGRTGKLLPRNVFKASLQINISENKNLYYDKYEKIKVEDKAIINHSQGCHVYSTVFDFVTTIQKLDKAFAADIRAADRVPGVYAIKDGKFGNRIEYRSLPNCVSLDELIKVLNTK